MGKVYSNNITMDPSGFVPFECEWWHFTLKDVPCPDTYFEFSVSAEYLRR